MNAAERRSEWLRVTLLLGNLTKDHLCDDHAFVGGVVQITHETFGKTVEYLLDRKRALQ